MRIKTVNPERRTSPDGIVFDSLGELKRWEELRLLERAGKIRELRRQVRFPLEINGRPVVIRSAGFPTGRRCAYTADYTYFSVDFPNVLTVEDFKPFATDAARLRIAVAECIYGFRVLLTGGGGYRTQRRSQRKWK